jgi:Protein of unknown function (DUF1553)/Protein of unknown function (DUF1549)/Planctomycete cytochrome C
MTLLVRTVLFSPLFLCSVASGAVDFAKDIKPILEARCYSCHGEEKQKAGVALHTTHHAHLPTDSGKKLFVPGQPEQSLAFEQMTASDSEKRMPKGKPALTAKEIATIRDWIKEGAVWPDDGWRPEKHWAYVMPVKAAVPTIQNPQSPIQNEIDAFVLARLEKEKLPPNPPADPLRLIRRLYLDVIGLPPTIAEADAFAANPSDAAYAKLVDDLLKRPQFGEKWARQWLDLARYADSDGYQRDSFRDIWLYRDWVINALNDDMPFDRFSIEQIAGDLLPNATQQQLIATGFHRNTTLNLEAGTDAEEDRVKQLVDRVNTTGTVWLGSSIGCAQCHNHKFDPFSTKEYYQLMAFFNGTPVESQQATSGASMSYVGPNVNVGGTAEMAAQRAQLEKSMEDQKRSYEKAVLQMWTKLEADSVKLAALTPAQREAAETPVQDRDFEACGKIHQLIFTKEPDLRKLKAEMTKLTREINAIPVTRSAVMKELDTPRESYIMKRGDFLSHGETVKPGIPTALHDMPKDAPMNRLGLARWLVSRENPLVARVTVNRWWAELFGQPLMPTMEDFGKQGAKPVHPELLDWLAVAFMDDDHWSMKASLRRMLLSRTYRQSASVRPDQLEKDPNNTLFSRANGARLEAETIRDCGLAVSGLLSLKLGGPPVKPVQPPNIWRVTGNVDNKYVAATGEDGHRRGIYTLWRRHAHYPSFANFDAPNRCACTIQRSRSDTPLQALTLMNDPAYVEMARALATHSAQSSAYDLRAKVISAFRTVLTRRPTDAEAATLSKVYEKEKAAGGSEDEAWFSVASVLLNLHETITRP